MKPRVTGRVRRVHRAYAGAVEQTFVIEMRPSGLTVRRLHGRRRYEVVFDKVLVYVKLWILQDEAKQRQKRREKIAGVRRAAKGKNQLVMPAI